VSSGTHNPNCRAASSRRASSIARESATVSPLRTAATARARSSTRSSLLASRSPYTYPIRSASCVVGGISTNPFRPGPSGWLEWNLSGGILTGQAQSVLVSMFSVTNKYRWVTKNQYLTCPYSLAGKKTGLYGERVLCRSYLTRRALKDGARK
jgi:hypothetical protein